MVSALGNHTYKSASKQVLGLVLAGGKSSRMGQDKGQLRLGNRSLLNLMKQTFYQSGIEQVIVSSNQIAGAMQDKIPGCGPLSALHSIVNEPMAMGFEGVLVAPVDMPLLQPCHLIQLRQYGLTNKCACYYDSNYLPVFIPFSKFLKSLINQHMDAKDYALKHVLAKLKFSSLNIDQSSIEKDELTPFYNVNTPQQWRELNYWQSTQDEVKEN